MKRFLAFILVIALVFAFAGYSRQSKARKEIVSLVENHYDTILTACREKDADTLCTIPGITRVAITDGYMLVSCGGAGIAPSSQDYGFYYAADGSPVAVDCNLDILCREANLTPKGKGFQYTDSGHNVFYTEHIADNLFFYSNSY